MVGTWGNCDPKNPKNARTRSSILVEDKGVAVLVDTTPDVRNQLLRHHCTRLDAALLTHSHYDHVGGLDDLRPFYFQQKKPFPVYTDGTTWEDIYKRFSYIFNPPTHEASALYPAFIEPHVIGEKPFQIEGQPREQIRSSSVQPLVQHLGGGRLYPPLIAPHEVEGQPFQIEENIRVQVGPLSVQPFFQDHGFSQTLGFRFGNIAYSTDIVNMTDTVRNALKGIDVWVVDCLRREKSPTHSHLAQTLEWIEEIKPKRAFLTHMGYTLDYEALCQELPAHVRPCYDGLEIIV